MIFDARMMISLAMRVVAISVLLGLGALLGIAVALKWPLNLAGAIGLTFLGYCMGRAHESDIATRPTVMITSLPTARARRRSDG